MTLVIKYGSDQQYYLTYDGGSYRKFLALLVVEEDYDISKPYVFKAVDYFKEIDLGSLPENMVSSDPLNAVGVTNFRQVVAQIFHDKRRLSHDNKNI